MTPDINVLVAASRSDHPHHAPALEWLNKSLAAAVLDLHEHLATFDRGFRRLLKARDLTILKS